MSKFGGIDFKQFKEFSSKIENLNSDELSQDIVKDVAEKLLEVVISKTKPGVYPYGNKVGGTLKRGWTGFDHVTPSMVDKFLIAKNGNRYSMNIINDTYYASFVEFGHKTRGGKGWVNGRFYLTLSEGQVSLLAPKIVAKRFEKFFNI